MPEVSIITPTFNHEKYIDECIRSVLAQTFTDWEMIIIDDGSTDQTWHIVKNYAARDSRIRTIRHNHNWGPYRLVDTYNEGLQLSRGSLIALLEGDDYWPVNKLQIQKDEMAHHPNAILSYGLLGIDRHHRVIPFRQRHSSDIKNNRPIGTILKVFLCGQNIIGAPTVLVKKEALQKICIHAL